AASNPISTTRVGPKKTSLLLPGRFPRVWKPHGAFGMHGIVEDRHRERNGARSNLANEIGATPKTAHSVIGCVLEAVVSVHELPIVEKHPPAEISSFQIWTHGFVCSDFFA